MAAASEIPYGRRLIPSIVDEIAQNDQDRVCFSIPRSSSPSEGFRDIPFRTFANAISKMAWFIQEEISHSSMFESILYMGASDIRAYIVLIAGMKTGHKILFSDHGNSAASHANFVRQTGCNVLLHTSGFPIYDLLEVCKLETLVMPELNDLLSDTPCKPYPFSKTWEEAWNNPCMIACDYGSSDPVVWTHAAFLTVDAHHLVSPLAERPSACAHISEISRRTYNAWPVYGSSLAAELGQPIFFNRTTVLGPPGLVNADTFEYVLDYANIDGANCLPPTLEAISTRPGLVAKLPRLKFIACVGGILSETAGNTLSKSTYLLKVTSAAQTSALVLHLTDPEDWEYICVNPIYNGIQFKRVGAFSNLYQFTIIKDPSLALFQDVFKVFPHLNEYTMSEVFSKHPWKPHHWKLEGQRDSVILLRNGWTINPFEHEQIICANPIVQHCILIGSGKDAPAALVELNQHSGFDTRTEPGRLRALQTLWPQIEFANKLPDPMSRLIGDLVLFATPERPFPLSKKGYVERGLTIKLYEEEIERAYSRARLPG